MKVIVAGSRAITNKELIFNNLDRLNVNKTISHIVCGEARGVDSIGKEWALKNNIEVISCPANWKREGKAAGFIRNLRMSTIADALIAFWDYKSKGTKHMIDIMYSKDKPVTIIKCN